MGFWKRRSTNGRVSSPPRNDEALTLLVSTLISVAMADGEFETPEAERVASEYLKLTGSEVSVEFVKRTARIVTDGSFSLVRALRDAAAKLSPSEREQILCGAIAIAHADGDYEDAEGTLIGKVADALAISPERRQQLAPPRS